MHVLCCRALESACNIFTASQLPEQIITSETYTSEMIQISAIQNV